MVLGHFSPGPPFKLKKFVQNPLSNLLECDLTLIAELLHVYSEVSPIGFNETNSQKSTVPDSKMTDPTRMQPR